VCVCVCVCYDCNNNFFSAAAATDQNKRGHCQAQSKLQTSRFYVVVLPSPQSQQVNAVQYTNCPRTVRKVVSEKKTCGFYFKLAAKFCSFTALSLSVGRQERHPACKQSRASKGSSFGDLWGRALTWSDFRKKIGQLNKNRN